MQENRSAYRLDQEGFLRKSHAVHGDRYDYSKAVYVNQRTKVCIICPVHGEFWQLAKNHMNGQGCPECGKEMNRTKFNKTDLLPKIPKKKGPAPKKYDLLYLQSHNPLNLDIVPFDGDRISTDKIEIKCPIHGIYEVLVSSFLHGKGNCRRCVLSKQHQKKRLDVNEIRQRIEEKYGDKITGFYETFTKSNEPMKFRCNVCGHEFMRRPAIYLHGPLTYVCPKCGKEEIHNERTKTTEQYIADAKRVHGDGKYDYANTVYVASNQRIEVKCLDCGRTFWIEANSHLQGHGCPYHFCNSSTYEQEICDWLSEYGIKYIQHNRNILSGNELDIYLPDYKIAIEVNGIFWHNELYKDQDYHLKKTEKCLENGIRLIHIFEDEWLERREIWKSILSNILGLNNKYIAARKCEIRSVAPHDASEFLNQNHLQGSCGSRIRYGLYYKDELVALMTFGKTRHFIGASNHDYELLRFCTRRGVSVVGGASRLFKHFINTYNPQSVVSYADRRWSVGGLYEKLGFNLYNISAPNYYYVIKNQRKNRFNFRKSVLVEKYGCPETMSEHEFCLSQKWYRIYDCGCLCFEWKR